MSDQRQLEAELEQATTGIENRTSNIGDISLSQIFRDEQLLVSHDGLSQYQRHSPSAGHSACGLAALECARLIFEKQNDGVTDEGLIRWLSSRQGAEEITSICDFWTSPSHLDVDDILKVPYFGNSVNLVETRYGQCGLANFRALLENIQKISTLSAVIITKPPEIVACIKLPTLKGDVFLIFDSHTRLNHPNGAALILNSSVQSAANYLSRLFWVDEGFLRTEDDAFGFQMDLIRQFCGYIIVPKLSSPKGELALTRSLLDASIVILVLTTELADSKATNTSLKAELRRADDRISYLQRSVESAKEITLSHVEKQRNSGSHNNVESSSGQHGLQETYPNPPQLHENLDQTAYSSKGWLKTASERIPSALGFKTRKQVENDFEYAVQLQEDLQNRGSRENWSAKGKGPFTDPSSCMSCSKEHSKRDMMYIPLCRHEFCRGCLREYVSSSLRESRFPILCPICVAHNNYSAQSGSIDSKLAKRIGITQEDSRTFQKLQAKGPFDLLHCPRCQTGSYVGRKEYREMKILNCPSCIYLWCKKCQQEVTLERQHDCCVSSEVRGSQSKTFAQAVSAGRKQ